MSELDNWLGKNLPAPDPRNPDAWLTGESSLNDVDKFLTDCLSLHINEFEGIVENHLLNALHSAAFGIVGPLALLIAEEKYVRELTDIQRKTIAWVLCNKPSRKMHRRNSSAIHSNLIRNAANLHGWCGYPKSLAIEIAAMSFIASPSGKYAELINEKVPKEFIGEGSAAAIKAHKESLADCSDFNKKLNSTTQTIWRALASEPFKGLFEDIVKAHAKRLEEIEKSRNH